MNFFDFANSRLPLKKISLVSWQWVRVWGCTLWLEVCVVVVVVVVGWGGVGWGRGDVSIYICVSAISCYVVFSVCRSSVLDQTAASSTDLLMIVCIPMWAVVWLYPLWLTAHIDWGTTQLCNTLWVHGTGGNSLGFLVAIDSFLPQPQRKGNARRCVCVNRTWKGLT